MFLPILYQMIFLFAFMLMGFILRKCKLIPDNTAAVLSKLENYLFVPALVLGTFLQKCTIETIKTNWQLLLMGLAFCGVLVAFSFITAKFCYKNKTVRNIAWYSVAFSNMGFMGNAIMQSVFGDDVFFQYIIFTLPIWVVIYLWGAPVLLIGEIEEKSSDSETKTKKNKVWARIKSFLNPMFVALLIGALLGLCGAGKWMPDPVMKIITVSGDCMSPIAMLLTGITIGQIRILALLKKWQIYVISFIKLILYPAVFIIIFAFVPQNSVITPQLLACAMCLTCMPTGLNGIVIPAAYGKDTTDAAGLALCTHLFSLGTIPLMFWLFSTFVATMQQICP